MAFSYLELHNPFLLDTAYLPRTPIEMLVMPPQVGEMNINGPYGFSYPPYSTSSEEASSPAVAAPASTDHVTPFDGSSSLDTATASEPHDIMENKRKSRDHEDSLITAESKDVKEGMTKKQKRSRGGLKRKEQEKRKTDDELTQGSTACLDSSDGYVHVRARRGQATDSHSLAERVRRERISQRMKMLKDLVPGCGKVTGKALMLDEIINYVQSLQNQVEFLSMKIASLSPIVYDFNVDFVDCINQQQKVMRSVPQSLPSADQTCHHLQAKAFDSGSTTSYQMMDHSALLLQQAQGPTTFSQDGGSAMQVGAPRQDFLDQVGFISMCSFQ